MSYSCEKFSRILDIFFADKMAVNKDSDNAKLISIAEWWEIFENIDNDEEFDEHTYNPGHNTLVQLKS